MINPTCLIDVLRREHKTVTMTEPPELLEDVDGLPLAVGPTPRTWVHIGPVVLTGPEWQAIARHLLAELDDATPGELTQILPARTAPTADDPAWLLELLRAEGRPVTHRIDPEPIAGENGEPIGATFARTETVPLSVSYTAEEWEIVARHLIAQTKKENAR
ncbi:hypothetical protein V3N95_03840 [Micrococcaceae bacterium Sec6.3]